MFVLDLAVLLLILHLFCCSWIRLYCCDPVVVIWMNWADGLDHWDPVVSVEAGRSAETSSWERLLCLELARTKSAGDKVGCWR